MGVVRDLIQSGLLEDRQLQELRAFLLAHPPSVDGLVLAWRTDYEVWANFIDATANGSIPLEDSLVSSLPPWARRWATRYILHPNRTKRDLSLLYSEMIDQAGRCYGDLRLTQVDELITKKQAAAAQSGRLTRLRVQVGALMCANIIECARFQLPNMYNTRTSHAATVTLAALYEFRRAHGDFPTTLTELVPDLMHDLPRDPFDGKHLRHSRQRGMLYSVGQDLEDSGGSTELRPGEEPSQAVGGVEWNGEDLVFQVMKQSPPEAPDRGE